MDKKWNRNRRFNKFKNDHERKPKPSNENASAEASSSNPWHQRHRGHPPHLRGKAIGMFYAHRNKTKKMQPEEVGLGIKDEKKISSLLNKIQNNDVEGYSERGADVFMREYRRHLQEEVKELVPHIEGCALQPCPVLDKYLLSEKEKLQNTTSYLSMQKIRRSLPVFQQEKEIIEAIQSNQVVVISGETGCGKTTQVPQLILDSCISQGRGSQCHIVCTQPRRISAISVAERVAEERAEQCGGANSSIGWQIRLESKIPRTGGSILYCTTGIVLQWLKSDRFLKNLSHIILDEIHERDLDSDFLMIILKDLLHLRPDLKLILMSATLNAQMFSKYFYNCAMIHIPGSTFPVTEIYLEDILEQTGYSPMTHFKWQPRRSNRRLLEKQRAHEEFIAPFLRNISDRYARKTIDTLREWDEDEIDFRLIVTLVKDICLKKKDGAILIFLPGWTEISKLHTLLTEDVMFRSSNFLLVPLHSMMPTVNQREVFNTPPKGTRKIVIATNIAETSITINDVVYVIDCGFIKMSNFDVQANVSTLKPEWVAMANAKQRRGRAGRVQPGICFKLYTRAREMMFESYCKPEMLRTRLETLCLKLKILKLGSIEAFLAKAMDPPGPESLSLAIDLLKKLNALDGEEKLTPLGFHLARLPLDPQTGKMILFGAMFSCLNPVLTVAASLSFKDAFLTPLGKEQLVDERKKVLSRNSQSDHLMLANAFDEWEDACKYGNGHSFCWKNFLSSHTLKMLSGLRKQFAEYLHELHFLHCTDPKHIDFNRNSDNKMVVKAVISAGLYPNVAKLKSTKASGKRERPPTLFTNDGKVTFHPKSVLNGEKEFSSLWVVYYQKVKSSKVYLHDMTVVHPHALLLFGGSLTISEEDTSINLSMDQWIKFSCQERVAELIPALRKELDSLLEHKISSPSVTNWKQDCKEGAVLQSIVDLLSCKEEVKSLPSSSFPEELSYQDEDYSDD